ncbi:hypothetical protein F3J23_19100 [Chryseobacterium sp. Tr-659]|nr:hypothetical protein [Chryseobacterium sp. Tr-659]
MINDHSSYSLPTPSTLQPILALPPNKCLKFLFLHFSALGLKCDVI